MLISIMSLAIPNLLSFIFLIAGSSGVLYFLGRLEPKFTSALGLGSTISGMIAQSPLIAFASGLDTMIPQSFGKRDFRMCGIYLNRGILILFLVGIPLYTAVMFASPILRAMGIQSDMAALSARYALCLIPNVLLGVVCNLMNSFMSGQRVVVPITVIACVTSILLPFWVWFFVFFLDGGYLGAAYANGTSALITLTATALYVNKSGKFDKTVSPWNAEVLKGWGTFFTVCGHSGLMSCIGAWGYHIMSIFAGHLTTDEMAAHVAMLNILAWLYMAPVGVGNAAMVLVGNKLGERNVSEALAYAKVCVVTNQAVSLVVEIGFLVFRHPVSRLYSSDPTVQALIASVIPVAVCANFFDVVQGIFSKLIYAMGKQKYASVVLLVSHWIVRIPFALIVTFVLGAGLHGLWTAFIVSYACTAVGFVYIVVREDWAAVAQEIYDRIERDKMVLGS